MNTLKTEPLPAVPLHRLVRHVCRALGFAMIFAPAIPLITEFFSHGLLVGLIIAVCLIGFFVLTLAYVGLAIWLISLPNVPGQVSPLAFGADPASA
ncbi:MAG: hypothetical protein ACOYM3_27830, partial [Terrimicrobiaceae bacterium]